MKLYYKEGIGEPKNGFFYRFTKRFLVATGSRIEIMAYIKLANDYRSVWEFES